MGSRGSSSSTKYNSSGNEYINRFKNRNYAESVRKKLSKYSDKDIDDAIETIKNGMQFNNQQMKANMNKPLASQHNYGLYERNVKLETELKEFQFEKKKRKQDKKQAKEVLSTMKKSGMKPVKNVDETAEILRKVRY